jgi:hypothetical protein
VHQPSSHQAEPGQRHVTVAVRRKLREFGAAHGIAVVDRQSLLTEADGKSLVVNRFDTIPNKLAPIIRE